MSNFLLLINSIIITVKGNLNPKYFSWKYHKMSINWATKLFINMIDLSVKSHKLGLVEARWALGSLGYAWYLDWVDWSGPWLGLGYGSLFGSALCALWSIGFVVCARCGYFWAVLGVISLFLGFWLHLCDDWWR